MATGGSVVVSLRVPERVKRVLEEKGVDYKSIVRSVLEALADVVSGEAVERMQRAFSMADSVRGDVVLEREEIVRAVRCPGDA